MYKIIYITSYQYDFLYYNLSSRINFKVDLNEINDKCFQFCKNEFPKETGIYRLVKKIDDLDVGDSYIINTQTECVFYCGCAIMATFYKKEEDFYISEENIKKIIKLRQYKL